MRRPVSGYLRECLDNFQGVLAGRASILSCPSQSAIVPVLDRIETGSHEIEVAVAERRPHS